MWKKASIGFRLTCMIVLLLVATCAAIIIINVSLSRDALKKEITTRTLPAMASEVVAEVDRQLVAPATTLAAMAAHPMLQDWIRNGEDPAHIPLVYQASRNVAAMHKAGGVNVVLRDSLNYYALSDGKENTQKVDPVADSWFFDFEKSGSPLWVNIHGPDDAHYANMAFINRRIDDDGRFLGIISVGMRVEEFNSNLASMRIGEKGSTFLVRKNGTIMLHPDVAMNGKTLGDIPGFAPFAARALHENSMTFETSNAAGETIFVATRDIPILDAVVFTEADASEMLRAVDKAWLYSTAAGLAILLLGFILSAMFVRTITRPLRRIIEYASDVAAEKDVAAPADDVGGEIGALLLSVNTMVRSIAHRVDEIQEKSAEAERQTAAANAAFEDSRKKEQQVGELVATMLRVSKEAEGIAEEVAGASQECARKLTDVSDRIEENDRRMAGMAAAMQRMQERVEAMTVSAATAVESTTKAKTGADKGEHTLKLAIHAIDNVNTQTDTLRGQLEALDNKADSIGAIMTVISDIADQTNLLALNAAIEAARAGDAGRGFAVVADEVRKLAEKTMQATQEVERNIKEIQQAAQDSIGEMAATLASVEEATTRADESGVELRAIVTSVDDSASRVVDITGAAAEQKETSLEVIDAMEDSTQATSRAIADMADVSHAVRSLASRATALRNLVEELASTGATRA